MISIFLTSWEYILWCMCGANLLIPAQMCDKLSCRKYKVYGQMDGHSIQSSGDLFPIQQRNRIHIIQFNKNYTVNLHVCQMQNLYLIFFQNKRFMIASLLRHPSSWLAMPGSLPFSSKSSMAAAWPFQAAECNGVSPSLFWNIIKPHWIVSLY